MVYLHPLHLAIGFSQFHSLPWVSIFISSPLCVNILPDRHSPSYHRFFLCLLLPADTTTQREQGRRTQLSNIAASNVHWPCTNHLRLCAAIAHHVSLFPLPFRPWPISSAQPW